MSYLICTDPDIVGPWVFKKINAGQWTIGSGIALFRGPNFPVAGAAFEGYNGYNINVHLCIEEKRATGLLFKLIGFYAFRQLGLKRLTLMAEASNIPAVRLHERLGAVLEGRLVGAGPHGDDILISRLTPDCRLWRRWNGEKQQSSPSAELRGTDTAARAV